MESRIEIAIPTRGREQNLLMLLQALRCQTFQQWDLTIVDDNDDPALLRQSHTFNVMLNLMHMEGHLWHIIRGTRQGPHFAHNILLMSARHELVLRLDDDLVPSPDFVAKLLSPFSKGDARVGAVGGVFPDPRKPHMEDCFLTSPEMRATAEQNPMQSIRQRYLHKEPIIETTPALYSSFLYRRSALLEAGGFPTVYSPIGESEETDTTFRLYQKGYTLLVDQSAVAWHFYAPFGGIRDGGAEERALWFQQDVATWQHRLGLLRDGAFDYETEKKQNLEPFRGFEKLRLHRQNCFINYP